MGSLKENLYDWHGANEWIFLQVNSIHSPLYDHIMQMLSAMGKHELFPYYFLLAVICAVVTTLVKKTINNSPVRLHITRWFGVLLVLTAGYPAMGLTAKYIKHQLAYERPYERLDSKDVTWIEPQEKEKATLSFPSGHATFIMFMLVALWPVMSENIRWIAVVVALGVGWSRMAVGVHFPADVVGGFLLGGIITWLVRMVIYGFLSKFLKIHC